MKTDYFDCQQYEIIIDIEFLIFEICSKCFYKISSQNTEKSNFPHLSICRTGVLSQVATTPIVIAERRGQVVVFATSMALHTPLAMRTEIF
jgi:hypothetical protein